MLRTLIALKTDGSITMANGFSPLMYAAYAGHEGAVRVLLQAGADPSSRTTDSKQSAADFAASRGHQKLAAHLREVAEKGRVTSR
jgi:ankyrin repeat protein